jgi:hypothetical protein
MGLRYIEQRLERVLSNATQWLPDRELKDMLLLVTVGSRGCIALPDVRESSRATLEG